MFKKLMLMVFVFALASLLAPTLTPDAVAAPIGTIQPGTDQGGYPETAEAREARRDDCFGINSSLGIAKGMARDAIWPFSWFASWDVSNLQQEFDAKNCGDFSYRFPNR